MVYFIDLDLKDNWLVYVELSWFYGLGLSCSKKICNGLGLRTSIRVKDLDKLEWWELFNEINRKLIIGEARRNVERIIVNNQYEIKSYKAFRKMHGLPANGQRTWSNAKTAKKLNKQLRKI